MSKGLELYQSRVSRVELSQGYATVYFPHASIYQAKGTPGRDPGTVWSQEAQLVLEAVSINTASTTLPQMIEDGYLELDGTSYEVIPLPLGEHTTGHLRLTFSDGSELDLVGTDPHIKLIGSAKRLEDF